MTPAPRRLPDRRLLLGAVPALLIFAIAAISLGDRLGGSPAPGATVLPPSTPRIVFAEFGLNEDRIYSAPADAPDDRVLHATVPHAPGWGLNPAIASAGPLVAYTILPSEAAPERGTPAELWVLNIATQNLTRLALDADLLAPPVFVDGGAGLVYRRSQGAVQELVRVEVADLRRDVVHREQTTFGIFPVGRAADGSLLFARISTQGTDLLASRPDGEVELLFRASEDIARDWQMAPDGHAISFLAPVVNGERAVYRARVVSLTTLEDITPTETDGTTEPAATEQYGPVWIPDGSGITVGQEADLGEPTPAVMLHVDGSRGVLPAPDSGFDVPLAWSPDGQFLAVRSFDGHNSTDAGFDSTVVVNRDGGRLPVHVSTEVIFLGWYAGA